MKNSDPNKSESLQSKSHGSDEDYVNTRERFKKRGNALWVGAQYASIGIEFGLYVVLCVMIGRWAEGRWGGAPWGTLSGVILGFCAALRSLVRIAMREEAQNAKKRAEKEREKQKTYPSTDSQDH